MTIETDDALQALVYRQVEIILHHDTVVELGDVVAAVAQNTGQAPNAHNIKRMLDAHPSLTPAGVNTSEIAIYRKGLNPGPTKRSPIGGRR